MAKVNVGFNLDDVDGTIESGFQPVPKGEYGVVVVEHDVQPSRAGNSTDYSFQLEIIEVDDDQDPEKAACIGRKLFDHIYVSNDPENAERGRKRVKNALEAFGVEADSDGYDPEDFVGKQAWAEVYQKFKRVQDEEGKWVNSPTEKTNAIAKYNPAE